MRSSLVGKCHKHGEESRLKEKKERTRIIETFVTIMECLMDHTELISGMLIHMMKCFQGYSPATSCIIIEFYRRRSQYLSRPEGSLDGFLFANLSTDLRSRYSLAV